MDAAIGLFIAIKAEGVDGDRANDRGFAKRRHLAGAVATGVGQQRDLADVDGGDGAGTDHIASCIRFAGV